MTEIPAFILQALEKQAPKYLLNDCHKKYNPNKKYHHEAAIYDFSLDKTSSELGNTSSAINKQFLDITPKTKLAAIRRYPDDKVHVVHFIYSETKYYNCEKAGPQGELFGDILKTEYFDSPAECRAIYPEMFAKNGNFKRANIVRIGR